MEQQIRKVQNENEFIKANTQKTKSESAITANEASKSTRSIMEFNKLDPKMQQSIMLELIRKGGKGEGLTRSLIDSLFKDMRDK